MRIPLGVVLGMAALAGACTTVTTTSDTAPDRPALVDHHVHAHAPSMLAFLPDYCSSMGRVGACPEVFVSPPPLEALLEQMQAAGVGRAHVMSSGYLAHSPMMVPARADADELVRDSNRYTVELARQSQGRLAAFISVNPNSASALTEIAYWGVNPGATGLKLHLTNSGVDLRDPDQLQQLGRVFAAANQAGLAITVHMRTRAPDYGAQDVNLFLDQVLTRAPDVPVILAHAGGWGGLDAATWRAMDAFASAFEAGHPAVSKVYFELGQVYKADTPEADLERLASLVRRIGVDRYLVGSDWPFSGNLDVYLNQTLYRLPLSPDEWKQIRLNRGLAQ